MFNIVSKKNVLLQLWLLHNCLVYEKKSINAAEGEYKDILIEMQNKQLVTTQMNCYWLF